MLYKQNASIFCWDMIQNGISISFHILDIVTYLELYGMKNQSLKWTSWMCTKNYFNELPQFEYCNQI